MIALFRAVLACAPPGFRREYGAAMCADFARALADERTVHGAFGAFAYALGATWDLFATALREYAAMFFRDFSYALRALRKTPSFTAVVVATLALAIGANAAVFSILHAVVLAPLPYADPGRLVSIQASLHGKPFHFSLPDYADLVAQTKGTFGDAVAITNGELTLTGRGKPLKLDSADTTPRLFDVLGVRPELGRFASESDVAPGAAKTIVLSDRLWRTAFAADPRVIGSIVTMGGDHYRLIGVAPSDFHQPRIGKGFARADVWTVLPENGTGTDYDRGYHEFSVIARLLPGVTLARATAAVDASALRLQKRYPNDDTELTFSVSSLDDALVGSSRAIFFALFAAVGAVLIVACANVANLLLSRAASRQREFSVRIAVGASRGRIVAQLLVETLVLALSGGTIGIAIAYAVVQAFLAFHPANVPRADTVSVDAVSIVYTFGIVAFCTLAAGLAPAFASSQHDVAVALKSAGRGGDASGGARARSALVASEIALTLALVVSAGLVLRSFIALTAQPLGFDPNGVTLVGRIHVADKRFETDAAQAAFMLRVLQATKAVPGVSRAAWGFAPPFDGSHWGTTFTIPGRIVRPGTEPDAQIAAVGPDYFGAIGARMSAGRTFDDRDRIGTIPVAIVNETFARRFFPGRSAIGARVVPGISLSSEKASPERTIVGVVADIRDSFTKPTDPNIYVPSRQYPLDNSTLVVRAQPGANVGAAVANVVERADPLLAAPDVVDMPTLLARDVAVQRLTVASLVALAFVALALSIAGVFAVVSYAVTQRTHEFGVRMALGADARGIVRMVLGGAMRLAFVGIVLGLVVAGAGTRLLGDQLYDTQPLDPLTFASVTALVLLAAVVAALVPARRATRVDPIVALRYE